MISEKWIKPIDFINAVTALDQLDDSKQKKSSVLLKKWGYMSLMMVFFENKADQFFTELLAMFPERFFEKHRQFSRDYGRKPKKVVEIPTQEIVYQPTLF